jgi:pimeloyl-ACP methyl ester carboxylesterase
MVRVKSIVRDALFPGHLRRPDPSAAAGIIGLERWKRDIGGETVEAWWLPAQPREGARSRGPDGRRPVVLFAHGNAELVEDWPDALAPLRAMGVHVLLPELRGYGDSGGAPSQAAVVEDFACFRARLLEREDVDPDRLVYIGRSLGGGVACALSTLAPPRALVLLSTFTSARAMMRRYLVPGFLVEDPFDNLSAVASLECPVWVVHGTRDDLVPTSHGRALAEAAKRGRLTLYDAGHNDCPPDFGEFFRELRTFFVSAGVLEG